MMMMMTPMSPSDCWRIVLLLQAAALVSSFSVSQQVLFRSHANQNTHNNNNLLSMRMSTPDGPFWTPNADQVTDRLNQVNGNIAPQQQQHQQQSPTPPIGQPPTAPQVSHSSTEGFRTQLNDFMKKMEDTKSYGGGTVNSFSQKGTNGESNVNGMSTPLQNQFPPKADEYDVVFPGESCFYFLETEKGETAFGGYKPLPNGEKSPAELCNLVRNVGDVFVAIDGMGTAGKPYDEVWNMLKATENNAYCCYRFRDINYAHTEDILHVPSERQKELLTNEMQALERQVTQKAARIDQIDAEKKQLQKEMEQLSQEIKEKQKEFRALEKEDIQWMEQRLQEMKSKVENEGAAEE